MTSIPRCPKCDSVISRARGYSYWCHKCDRSVYDEELKTKK